MYLHEIENMTNIWFNCKKALNQTFDFLDSKLSHLPSLCVHVPDEGFHRNVSCALNWISTILLLTSHICQEENVKIHKVNYTLSTRA